MDQKSEANTGQAGNEVTFPSLYGCFGSVGVVHVWWRKLLVQKDRLCAPFQSLRAFIVQYLYNRFDSLVGEVMVDIGQGTSELALAAGLHGFGQDFVGILVIKIMMYLVPRLEMCGNPPV